MIHIVTKRKPKASSTRAAKKITSVAKPALSAKKTEIVERKLVSVESLNLIVSTVILVLLLYMVVQAEQTRSHGTEPAQLSVSEDDCQVVCTQIGREFAFVTEDNVCWCSQAVPIPDFRTNKTMEVTIASQVGIITGVKVLE